MITLSVIKFKEDVTHWPDSKANYRKCTFVGKDNIHYDGDLHKTEVELIKFLTSIKHKLKDNEINKLIKLIELYGEHKYDDGSLNESMSNADSSI